MMKNQQDFMHAQQTDDTNNQSNESQTDSQSNSTKKTPLTTSSIFPISGLPSNLMDIENRYKPKKEDVPQT